MWLKQLFGNVFDHMAPSGLVAIATWYYCLILHKESWKYPQLWKLRKSCVLMFDTVRSLQKVKTQVLPSSKSCVFFFLMTHKLRKNKRRSFSAATNLKTQQFKEKNAATKLNTQFFCNSKSCILFSQGCNWQSHGTLHYGNVSVFVW